MMFTKNSLLNQHHNLIRPMFFYKTNIPQNEEEIIQQVTNLLDGTYEYMILISNYSEILKEFPTF